MTPDLRATLGVLLYAPLALVVTGCRARAPAIGERVPAAVAISRGGMVVSGSRYATEAGVRMLERGGNAIDAAVAAAFGLAVAEPTQSGVGGRTQILIRLADGTVHGIDGTTEVPSAYDASTAPQGEHGHGAVGIPGTVAALARALEEHGSLPLATVIAPAAGWAREGIALSPGEARRIAEVAPELGPGSEVARVFLGSDGAPLTPGDTLVQPDLASVLETLARDGAEAFYRGDIARRIAADMSVNGGFVSGGDLAGYRAVDSEIGRGRFGDTEVAGTYLPASGVTVIEILQVLDRVGVDAADRERWVAALVETLLAGFEDREIAQEWPAARAVAWLTSDSLAERRAAGVRTALHEMETSSRPRDGAVPALARDDGSEPPFTTHVSVADTLGNVVSLTQSLGPTLGARVVTPGLGFLYASTLGGYLTGGGPGHRPWSSQAPLIVLRSGRPVLVIGGAGARRILSALVSTLARVVEGGVDLEEALRAPRLHPTGDRVEVQEGWGVADALGRLGFRVVSREPSYFARLNAVEILPDGTFRGVGEPRWDESTAAGPRRRP